VSAFAFSFGSSYEAAELAYWLACQSPPALFAPAVLQEDLFGDCGVAGVYPMLYIREVARLICVV